MGKRIFLGEDVEAETQSETSSSGCQERFVSSWLELHDEGWEEGRILVVLEDKGRLEMWLCINKQAQGAGQNTQGPRGHCRASFFKVIWESHFC